MVLIVGESRATWCISKSDSKIKIQAWKSRNSCLDEIPCIFFCISKKGQTLLAFQKKDKLFCLENNFLYLPLLKKIYLPKKSKHLIWQALVSLYLAIWNKKLLLLLVQNFLGCLYQHFQVLPLVFTDHCWLHFSRLLFHVTSVSPWLFRSMKDCTSTELYPTALCCFLSRCFVFGYFAAEGIFYSMCF